MKIENKYDFGLGNALNELINNELIKYSQEELNGIVNNLVMKIKNIGQGKTLNDTIKFNNNFNINISISEYILSGAPMIVDFIKEIFLKQIALHSLTSQCILMPINLRNKNYFDCELDIHYPGGNSMFQVNLDLLPYDNYLILNEINNVNN